MLNNILFTTVCSSILKADLFFGFFCSLIQYCFSSAETEHLKSYTIKMMNSSVRACWLPGRMLTYLWVNNR